MVRRTCANRARRGCCCRTRREPTGTVPCAGSVGNPGRSAVVRPGQSTAPPRSLRADHARARSPQHRQDAVGHRSHYGASQPRQRPGSAGVPCIRSRVGKCPNGFGGFDRNGPRSVSTCFRGPLPRSPVASWTVMPTSGSPRRVPTNPVWCGASSTSNVSAWRCRAGIDWRGAPGCGCPPWRWYRSHARAWTPVRSRPADQCERKARRGAGVGEVSLTVSAGRSVGARPIPIRTVGSPRWRNSPIS